ncbi:MAG: flagellar assembly protein FliX [Rhizobiales bacterium]|nr:flagellar assembly protein FliX [Hyphomicrobiales bacterium]
MRIGNTQSANRLRNSGNVRRASAGSGSFQAQSTAKPESAQNSAPAPTIAGIDALLALQSVGPRGGRRAKAMERGHSMLDVLEDMRLDLLAGTLSGPKLQNLLKLVKQRGDGPIGEPGLENLLEEIELRARVELAKRGLADH